jgi:hypothetical protein
VRLILDRSSKMLSPDNSRADGRQEESIFDRPDPSVGPRLVVSIHVICCVSFVLLFTS